MMLVPAKTGAMFINLTMLVMIVYFIVFFH